MAGAEDAGGGRDSTDGEEPPHANVNERRAWMPNLIPQRAYRVVARRSIGRS
jgi:hypothetical protein